MPELSLLAHIAIAIYYEALLGGLTAATRNTIQTSLEGFREIESATMDELERNSTLGCRKVINWMLSKESGYTFDRASLLQRFREVTGRDELAFKTFSELIVETEDDNVRVLKKESAVEFLESAIVLNVSKKVFKKRYHALSFGGAATDDWDAFLNEAVEEIRRIPRPNAKKGRDPSLISTIDSVESLTDAFIHMQDKVLSVNGGIKYPLQAVNAMCGEDGFFRRGKVVSIPATPHQNKSGVTLNFFIGAGMYNQPYVFEEGKRPAIWHITVEEPMPMVLRKLFVTIMQIETGLPVAVRGVDPKFMSEYVYGKLEASGWKIFIDQVDPNTFTHSRFVKILTEREKEGYEFAVITIDPMYLLSRSDCPAETAGGDYAEMFKRYRVTAILRNFLLVTPWQLNSKAKERKNMQPETFVRSLPDSGLYQYTTRLDAETDQEIFVNTVMAFGVKWQEFQLGKLREGTVPPEADKYAAIRFHPLPMWGFPFDIDKDKRLTVNRISRDSMGTGEDNFFE